MEIIVGRIYKNKDGEYFEAVEQDGKILLSNPSYPFKFLPEVQMPLEDSGADKSIIEKVDYQFHEGNTLNVKVNSDGLEVVEDSPMKPLSQTRQALNDIKEELNDTK